MNRFAPFFLIIAIALGALAAHQYQRAEHLRAVIAQMKKDAAAGREESDSQAAEVRTLKERTRTQKVAIDQLETRNKELVSAGPESARPAAAADSVGEKEGAGGFMKGIAKIWSDPKMKESMRGQQAAGVTMMYGGLAKELSLTSDEARQVLSLLTDRQVEQMSASMALLNRGELDAGALAEAGKQGETAKAGYDEGLKEVLGKERYAQFQEYEKSIGERFALDQVRNQLSAGGLPLDEKQAASLLTIMKEERARTPNQIASNDFAAQSKLLESGEMMEGMLKSQEAFNQRVLDRARSLLSPDQLQTFETSQKQQLDAQRMGAEMSRKMFQKQK